MRQLALLVSTAGGVGYAPFAPGTVGSLVGLALLVALRSIGGPWLEAGALLGVFAAGAWASTHAERHFGHIDPGPVVIDEVLGMLLTLMFLPLSWKNALVGFVLFRFFDVVKPPPCSRLEALRGGWGIMSDDAMAGLYAHAAVRTLTWLIPALR